jgi:AAA family ATP:ADP antiporter
MGAFSTVVGIVTVLMMLFVGGNAMRRGWGFAAIITPIVLMLTGAAFFSFVLFQDALMGMVAWFGTTPLYLAVMFGAAQNIMSKSCKYSLFDPTKEMAYIPLDPDSKTKGKAAIDVVGARLGKSGGSLIQQFLLVAVGSVGAMAPYVAILMCAIVGVWIVAVRALNKQFSALTAEREAEKAAIDAGDAEKKVASAAS